jgi:hypothetical protein
MTVGARGPRRTLSLLVGALLGITVGVGGSALWFREGGRPAAAARRGPDLEQERRQMTRQYLDAKARFAGDTRDATWARGAEDSLRSAFVQAAPPLGYQLEGAECRSRSCALLLKWSTRGEAERAVERLISLPLPINCQSLISVPDEGPDACNDRGCVASLLLTDCQRQPGG